MIALSLELLFLTLSVGIEFRKSNFKTWQSLAVTSGIAPFPTATLFAGFLALLALKLLE